MNPIVRVTALQGRRAQPKYCPEHPIVSSIQQILSSEKSRKNKCTFCKFLECTHHWIWEAAELENAFQNRHNTIINSNSKFESWILRIKNKISVPTHKLHRSKISLDVETESSCIKLHRTGLLKAHWHEPNSSQADQRIKLNNTFQFRLGTLYENQIMKEPKQLYQHTAVGCNLATLWTNLMHLSSWRWSYEKYNESYSSNNMTRVYYVWWLQWLEFSLIGPYFAKKKFRRIWGDFLVSSLGKDWILMQLNHDYHQCPIFSIYS